METQVVTITPEMATKLLRLNTHNRPLNRNNVAFLKRQLEGGKFVSNGDAIRVSKTDVLLDGQHRLTAVVESGLSMDCILVTGLDDNAFKTIDINRKPRSASDILYLAGHVDRALLNATANVASQLLRSTPGTASAFGNADIVRFTPEDALDFVSQHPWIPEALSQIKVWGNHEKCFRRGYVTAAYVFSRIKAGHAVADKFFYPVISSEGLTKETLLYSINTYVRKAGPASGLSGTYQSCHLIYAFSKWLQGHNGTRVRPQMTVPDINWDKLVNAKAYEPMTRVLSTADARRSRAVAPR